MYNILKKFNEKANQIVKFVIITVFSSMTILIFLQVIFRYVVKQSLSWSEELARYLFIWLTFIGASIAAREKSHINVSVMIDIFKSQKIRSVFYIFANMLNMVFLIVLIGFGSKITFQILQLKQISSSMPFLYIGIVYFAIPIGSILMLLNFIEHSIEILLDNKHRKEEQE